ncbi:MAG: hypothetical protein EBS94_15995, partial [Proteobacteria bacterium]|nr:hypothetical protein [Pseudomonadota bacterium]
WGATGGFFLGLLMLRPALQFTALILFVTALTGIAIQHVLMRSGNAPTLSSQVPTTRAWGTIAAVALGILVVAAPWFLTNALAFGNPVWSRTGNSWQQVNTASKAFPKPGMPVSVSKCVIWTTSTLPSTSSSRHRSRSPRP